MDIIRKVYARKHARGIPTIVKERGKGRGRKARHKATLATLNLEHYFELWIDETGAQFTLILSSFLSFWAHSEIDLHTNLIRYVFNSYTLGNLLPWR